MPGLAEAHLGVRHHHERFDGTGYPDGLAGSTIPLEARIVAAADLFSTLTARGDLDRVSAIAAVQHAAGTQLDPQVVAALVAVLAGRDAGHRGPLRHRRLSPRRDLRFARCQNPQPLRPPPRPPSRS